MQGLVEAPLQTVPFPPARFTLDSPAVKNRLVSRIASSMELSGTLVFASGRAVDFDLWTLDLASGQLTQLTSDDALYDSPVWSPCGQQIVCVRTSKDSVPSLYLMKADGSDGKRLTDGVYCQHPSWSPCGKSIVFTSNASNPNEIDISRYDVESGKVETLFRRAGIERDPSYSPDGKSILFASVHPNREDDVPDNTDIFEYNLETKEEKVLCSHPARDYSPVYSPDGKHIAFVSHRNGRSEEEFLGQLNDIRSNMDTSNIDALDEAIRKMQALQFDSDIYVMNRDGSELRQLTSNLGCDVGLCWSPDGRYLAYTSSVEGDSTRERLSAVEVATGKEGPLEYDRSKLRSDVGAAERDVLNQTWFQYLVPDFIEKKFVDASFWGEERQPSWKA